MLEVIIASLGYAGGIVSDKFILSKYKVPVMRFVPLLFIWIAVISGIFLNRWGHVDLKVALDLRYILLFIGLLIVALSWNKLYYTGIQKENLHEFELIMLLSPLATIVFATIFFVSERDWGIFIPAIIAVGALIATRFRKHHVTISKIAWKTLVAMLLMSLESIFIKELLYAYSPVALYFIRTLMIATFFTILYRPKLLQMHQNAFALTILSAIFGVVQMVLKYIGFQSLGIVETTMILVLGPLMVYLASAIIFKESLYKRDIFAAVTVVLCILYVEFGR